MHVHQTTAASLYTNQTMNVDVFRENVYLNCILLLKCKDYCLNCFNKRGILQLHVGVDFSFCVWALKGLRLLVGTYCVCIYN